MWNRGELRKDDQRASRLALGIYFTQNSYNIYYILYLMFMTATTGRKIMIANIRIFCIFVEKCKYKRVSYGSMVSCKSYSFDILINRNCIFFLKKLCLPNGVSNYILSNFLWENSIISVNKISIFEGEWIWLILSSLGLSKTAKTK